MEITRPTRLTSVRRTSRRAYAVSALVAGAVAGGALVYERIVLGGLDGASDDLDRWVRFPVERVHAVVTTDGARLHVEECGSGRPVVLLHGHGASLGIFAPLAVLLAAGGRRVIAVDHRGFGGSSTMPSAFGLAGLVDDLASVLDALDLHDAVVVGHSMGGVVALGLAVDRPEIVADRVAALVLINSAARGPADRPLSRVKATALDWNMTERVGRHPRIGIIAARANFGIDAERSQVVAIRAIGGTSPATRRRGFTRRMLGIDLSARLGEVGVPALVLAGEADRVLAPRESERLAHGIDGARLEVFPGVGHMLPIERSLPVAELILRFAEHVDTDDGEAEAEPVPPPPQP